MKKNPIGIEDFKIIKEACYYVDKTKLIKFICDAPDTTVFLFTRPRRFGKSLALSMLEYYFSNTNNSKSLFEDTYIYKESEYIKYMNSRNVIHLNFKNVDASSYDNFIYSMKVLLAEVYNKSIKNSNTNLLSELEINYINDIISLKSNEVELKLSLEKLINIIYLLTNETSIVLIDEYDAPLNEAYKNGFYEKANDFLRLFLGGALKGNSHLYKAVLTGVTQIAHSSALSDLNNLRVYNVLSPLKDEFFGFTKEETIDLLNYYNFTGDFNDVDKYYGGYSFSINNIYNPWSIFSFIDNNFLFKNYWANTGSYVLLRDSIKTIADYEIEELSNLLIGDVKIIQLDETINFENSSLLNQIYTMLVFSGYLTASLFSEPNNFTVRIPNEEIKSIFKSEIINCYSNNNFTLLANLKEAFIRGDSTKIKDYFNKYVLTCFSYYDLSTEKTYQIIFTTLLAILFSEAIVKSEVNEGLGRCDIYMRFIDGSYSFVFELKKLKGRRTELELKKSSIAALNQIKNKNYYEEALKDNSKKILIYGVSFSEKKVFTSFEEIKK